MKVLVADDSRVTRRFWQAALEDLDYEVVLAEDGMQALEVLCADDAPRVALIDRMMPGLDGDEVCRMVRLKQGSPYQYIILHTATEGLVGKLEGYKAGCDDYFIKPMDMDLLRAKLIVAERILRAIGSALP